jgi:hypothetical protein
MKRLRCIKKRVLREVAGFLEDEAKACEGPHGICPEQVDAFLALMKICKKELKRRKRS